MSTHVGQGTLQVYQVDRNIDFTSGAGNHNRFKSSKRRGQIHITWLANICVYQLQVEYSGYGGGFFKKKCTQRVAVFHK